MTAELTAACERAVHVVTSEGEVLRAGRASLFILEGVGYRKTARVFSLPVLRSLVELGYWIVARNRSFLGRFLFRGE